MKIQIKYRKRVYPKQPGRKPCRCSNRLKKGALGSLNEMSPWRGREQAMLACIILGRIQGLSDDEIFKSWKNEPGGSNKTQVKKIGELFCTFAPRNSMNISYQEVING